LEAVLQDVFLRVRTAERDGLWRYIWHTERMLCDLTDMRTIVADTIGGVLASSEVCTAAW